MHKCTMSRANEKKSLRDGYFKNLRRKSYEERLQVPGNQAVIDDKAEDGNNSMFREF